MSEMLKIVTVTLVDENSKTATGSTFVLDGESVDDAIAQAMEQARDRYGDDGNSGMAIRAIVHIDALPVPTIPAVQIDSDIPAGEDTATVTSTIS